MHPITASVWLEEPDMDNTTRRERRRGRKINEIMTFTARLITERGFHQTNIEDIADQLDVSKASIYHYFDSKEALVLATLESCATYVERQLREIAEGPGSATERLTALISRQLEIINVESVEIARLFLQPVDWPPPVAAAVREWQREHGRIFRRVISEGRASGEFTCFDELVSNMAIQGAMNLVPSWFSQSHLSAKPGAHEAIVATLMLLVGVEVAAEAK
ncbi:MAG: TetR family transcriptional regulator [Frankiales bacterium]|nr:TetR family transcriptional regulator [Frankiales bacterium]